MIVWIFFCLFLANRVRSDTECAIVPTVSEDRRPNKTSVRLVQYNIEWMFWDYYAAADCPGKGCSWVNQSEVQIHMDHVVKVIRDLNPDIINFCEIEGCDELSKIQNLLEDDTYRPYLKKGKDTATGQNVGMLTRLDPIKSLYRTEEKHEYPIKNSQCGYTGNVSTSGVSKHYITEFSWKNSTTTTKIALIAAHLLALPTDKMRCAEREAQAMVLQNVISSYIQKGYEVIMMGDFNDYDGEIPDINANKPTSRVLDILKGEQYLYSVSEKIPQEERYSDWWDSDNNCKTSSPKDYSVIDHILVTKNIRDRIQDAFMYHGYQEYCGKYDSDHFPVVVDLEW
jgi:exonuclease III